ncbi:MAG: hypothetical protein A2X86_07690 [Bdellovibrionales bacterium GWA2_49_15]|nr:MAG: hypothetical protein A2X86_07690 [Bdellovibrionales bacterium GWA2_49_15]HAZ11840.1 hypothetical protein [Bdellovibrionales bacterium]
MSQGSFRANSWFLAQPDNESRTHASHDTFYGSVQRNHEMPEFPPLPEELDQASHTLANFFTPGWTGDGLFSKRGVQVQKVLHLLWEDAHQQFKGHHHFNKSLKISIFNYFFSYANHIPLNCPELSNSQIFWEHIDDKNSPYKKHLETFIDIYTFRGVSVYLYKLKYILGLARAINVPITETILFNPNAFLSRIFPKGSSVEFFCESLQSNQYSWYRPHGQFDGSLLKSCEALIDISINEMMKICTYRSRHSAIMPAQTKPKAVVESTDSDIEIIGGLSEGLSNLKFSHSLSHKSFGLFLTDLIIHYPKWAEVVSSRIKNETLSVKFVGEFLFSLSQGHWLAQEASLAPTWDTVICPDFHSTEFSYGSFIKICHELHFLSFLVRLACAKKLEVVQFVGRIMRGKYAKSRDLALGQVPLLGPTLESLPPLVYDRIIMNLTDLPKRNPHYHVLTQLQSQGQSLAPYGLIYLFTNQNLFVPSQSDKVEQLLNSYKLEGAFNFEGLKGKGEIADFLYIFSRRLQGAMPSQKSEPTKARKFPCFSFAVKGDLSQFHYFQKVTDEFRNFIKYRPNTLPLYQKELPRLGQFEFHQDAIVDGKLLHSITSPDNVTHPSFFKGLTQACLSMEQIFQIEGIDDEGQRFSITDHLLGMKVRPEQRYPFVLIVNLANLDNFQLEIVKSDALQAKRELYGQAYFQYFGLIPKLVDLNINVLKNYFESEIGQQIIQFSLNGGSTRIKGKLKGLLIPKSLVTRDDISGTLAQNLSFFKKTSKQILELHPDQLKNQLEHFEQQCTDLLIQYPWSVLSSISEASFILTDSYITVQGSPGCENVNYQNPLVLVPLLKLQTYALYPKNPDIFVDFLTASRDLIHHPMASRSLGQEREQHFLEICSENGPVLRCYGPLPLLKFIHFLLERAIGLPISNILFNLEAPKAQEIETIFNNMLRVEREIAASLIKVKGLLNTSFRRLFSPT